MKLFLENKIEIQSGVFTFVFKPETDISWQPGQYLHYTLEHPDADDRETDRYFTISSAPFEGKIELTTRRAAENGSSFKEALFNMGIGGAVEAEGPDGRFVWREGDAAHVFVAGGIGITPFRSMLLQYDHDNKAIIADLLYSNRDEQLIFGSELDSLAQKHPEFKIHAYIGREITIDDLAVYASSPKSVFYLSGPKSMVENFESLLLEIDVSADNILKDKFPGYSGVNNA